MFWGMLVYFFNPSGFYDLKLGDYLFSSMSPCFSKRGRWTTYIRSSRDIVKIQFPGSTARPTEAHPEAAARDVSSQYASLRHRVQTPQPWAGRRAGKMGVFRRKSTERIKEKETRNMSLGEQSKAT